MKLLDRGNSNSHGVPVPAPTPPSSKKTKQSVQKPKTPNRKTVDRGYKIAIDEGEVSNGNERINHYTSNTTRLEYEPSPSLLRGKRRPSSAPSKRRYFPADFTSSTNAAYNPAIKTYNAENNVKNIPLTGGIKKSVLDESALILSQLEISNSLTNTPSASIGHRSNRNIVSSRPQTSAVEPNLGTLSEYSQPENEGKSAKHVFFHNTKLQAHATRRFSAAENKRLKGRLSHLRRKEDKMKKEIHDYYTHMEKRIQILQDQKRLRQSLNRARAATAKRNGKLNDAARNIHKRLDAAKKERQEKLRKSARQTAEETKRNNEAYHELKLKRINDNRKIRDRVHTKRKQGTKRALAFHNKKINAVVQSRRAAIRKENEAHKKRLIKNERLHRKEAKMRELLDNLYEYKVTYEAQLEGMCKKLEKEVAEMRRKGREGIVFSVPKVRKGEAASGTVDEDGERGMKSKKNKIPNNSGKRRKGHQRIPAETPRSLMSTLDHHLSEFEEEHFRNYKINHYDSRNW